MTLTENRNILIFFQKTGMFSTFIFFEKTETLFKNKTIESFSGQIFEQQDDPGVIKDYIYLPWLNSS